MHQRLIPLAVLLLLAARIAPARVAQAEDATAVAAPIPVDQSAAAMTAPPGFRVTLFAGEPDVRQPIGMCFDDRGRLWVAECFSYPNWKPTGEDRIVIFEDTDNDGRFDKKKVFWDKGNYLTGLQVGFGGVWVCCAPHLLFIPDKDGDDVPDGPPQVCLEGWTHKGVHNVLNGLTWGPDGWLYGGNGITAPSVVGRPDDPPEDRIKLNCAIWRFHPVTKKFEVVCHGTTNPWGIDFNEYGDAFFINCVIGHLWRMAPGAHYQRMFGQDLNPHVYELMGATSDHLHWGGGKWTDSRGGQGKHSEAGGGHAHSGLMVYQGVNWPQEYRGDVFMCNIHGSRVNRDKLVRKGGGYVGVHARDFLFANDPWFRGVALAYGPDGGVIVADWNDTGECHDRENTQRQTGRLYKIVYGKTDPADVSNLAKLTDIELAKLHADENVWKVRHARRLLHERSAQGDISPPAAEILKKQALQGETSVARLRAIWTLYAAQLWRQAELVKGLDRPDEHERRWAVRLLVDNKNAGEAARRRLIEVAATEKSPLVRMELASALQRLPDETRWLLAEQLVTREEDANDAELPLMIWYGIESLVPTDKLRAAKLAAKCKIPKVRTFIARRIAEN